VVSGSGKGVSGDGGGDKIGGPRQRASVKSAFSGRVARTVRHHR